jgi:hypothetical protein
MARRVELFTVTTPALTAIAAPLITDVRFDIGVVTEIEILVPPGPSGLMGFAIMHSGASVFPREEGKWIISDGEDIHWPITDSPTAARWQVRSYNTDVFDHSIYLRFLVDEVPASVPSQVAPLAITQPAQPTPNDESVPTDSLAIDTLAY